jgi:hypothetical protein
MQTKSIEIYCQVINVSGGLIFVDLWILFDHKFKDSANISYHRYVLTRVEDPRINKSTIIPRTMIWFDLIWFDLVFLLFNVTFNNISSTCISWQPATSFSGGRSRRIRREPPSMGKQLVNFITCNCEWSAPFLQFTKTGANPHRIGDRLVWVVRQSNHLTHWATRALPEQRKVVFTTLSELRVL